MKKITYKLTTISSLIVSPRGSSAFYKDCEDFADDDITCNEYLIKDKLRVIYPFYRYGEYDKYMPQNASYYLPGSSIKGALCQSESDKSTYPPEKFMADDVLVKRGDIVLRNLYKAQFLKDESKEKQMDKKAKIDVFFENMAVEMVKAGAKMEGEIYLESEDAAKGLLKEANSLTRKKIRKMLQYYRALQERKEMPDAIKEAEKKLLPLSKDEQVFLLGGYKGLLHSIKPQERQENEGAVYLDMETMLPHGLVKIELI